MKPTARPGPASYEEAPPDTTEGGDFIIGPDGKPAATPIRPIKPKETLMTRIAFVALPILLLSTAARADSIGWVNSTKLDAGSTEVARLKSHVAGKSPDQAQQIRAQAMQEISTHLQEACAKVKADKHLSMVISDPLAADPKAEVTAEVLRLWNAADEAGVAQENARLTAQVAKLEAEKAALTKPPAPAIPPAPPTAPAKVASKGK